MGKNKKSYIIYAMKHVSVIAVGVLVFLVLALAGLAIKLGDNKSTSGSFQLEHQNPLGEKRVKKKELKSFSDLGLPLRPTMLGTEEFSLAVAEDKESRTSGLSGVESMQYYDGMLFVFEEPQLHGFWMKDMNFPLDIIWLDEAGMVIHIENNLSPDSYPKVFQPKTESLYVIELGGGVAEESGIKAGDQVRVFGQAAVPPVQ